MRLRSVMGRVTAVMAIAALLVGARPASGADASTDEARLRRSLAPEIVQQVLAIVRQARESALPTEPLVARALEGASRGADAAGIVAGVRRQAAALGEARTALGSTSQPDEVVAGASALMAGLPADSLARLRVSRPGGNLVISLVVLCDLLARGVPPDSASVAVLTAVQAGASDQALLRLRERIHTRIEAGERPANAASDILRQWLLQRPGKGRPGARPTPGTGG